MADLELDPDVLRARAASLVARSRRVAIVFALLGFAVGAPVGGVCAAGVDGLRRLNDIHSREDVSELVHSEDKREEVLSLFRHVPLGGLVIGLFGAGVAFAFGLERRAVLRVQAESALCLLKIEERIRSL